MTDKQTLIKALECSLSEYHKGQCVGCPYRGLEKVDSSIPCKPDTEIDGVEYWEYCDIEQMARDSIEILKREEE